MCVGVAYHRRGIKVPGRKCSPAQLTRRARSCCSNQTSLERAWNCLQLSVDFGQSACHSSSSSTSSNITKSTTTATGAGAAAAACNKKQFMFLPGCCCAACRCVTKDNPQADSVAGSCTAAAAAAPTSNVRQRQQQQQLQPTPSATRATCCLAAVKALKIPCKAEKEAVSKA